MKYSRAAPSPRYAALQGLYRIMHEQGEAFLKIPPEKTFPGYSLGPQAGRIRTLIERTGARTLLDYGSGKGLQYDAAFEDDAGRSWSGIAEYWGVDAVECYDPAFAPFSRVPSGTFDGVISTDVLEHCPEEDLPWIVDEIFGYAGRFVFANVACYPANKRLPSGENAHCTVKPVPWWRELLASVTPRYPRLVWEVWMESRSMTAGGVQVVEERIGS